MVLEAAGLISSLHILIAVRASAWGLVFICGMHGFIPTSSKDGW